MAVWLGATGSLRRIVRRWSGLLAPSCCRCRSRPNGVVNDAVHDRVVNAGAETAVLVLLLILGAEYRRAPPVVSFHQLEQHAAHGFCRAIKEPLVDDEEGEGGIFPQELRGGAGGVLGGNPGFLEVGHADVVGADAVFAGAFGDRAAQIRLPGPVGTLKDNVLLPGHE